MMRTFLEYLSTDEKGNYKGWMSPSGNAHVWNHGGTHSFNHHPDIEKEVEGSRIDDSLSRGYVRFGLYNGQHYVQYDQRAKGGKEAALHALKHLNPAGGSRISVERHREGNDFHSAGSAAQYIRGDKPK